MSNTEIEIVVDDPTAPEPDSPPVTDTRVAEVTVSLLLLGLAMASSSPSWRARKLRKPSSPGRSFGA